MPVGLQPTSPTVAALELRAVSKRYGDLTAVDQLTFSTQPGEIFGLLGPNGAGKTTTLEMIEGLRRPDGGTIHIQGHDVVHSLDKVKQLIGVQLQTTSLNDRMRVREALELFGHYYKKRRDPDELLDLVSLQEKRNTYFEQLSGGQKQRLALGLALVNDPEVVFLDEPTTGLDPQARRNLWDIITRMKSEGRTVILTTHYMEEAEKLCDRLIIMDHGKKIAAGSPAELIARMGVESCLQFSSEETLTKKELRGLPGVVRVLQVADQVEVFSSNSHHTLVDLISLAESKGVPLRNLNVHRPTLEDFFLEATGRSLRE